MHSLTQAMADPINDKYYFLMGRLVYFRSEPDKANAIKVKVR